MFDWLGQGTSIDRLIARGHYDRAIKLIRKELREGPKSARLLQKLADVLILAGETEKAVSVYHHLVDHFANTGFFAKAIAIAKKIKRLDPGNSIIDAQLDSLIESRDREAATARAIKDRSLKKIIDEDDVKRDEDQDIEIVIEAEDESTPTKDGETVFDNSPLFQDMTAAEVRAIVESLDLRITEPGEIIVTEGEPGDSMFLLASGVVRVYVQNNTGANREVRSIEMGDFFGEISLLTGAPRSATITAATRCELLELRRDNLVETAQKHPHLASIVETFCVIRSGSSEENEARADMGDER